MTITAAEQNLIAAALIANHELTQKETAMTTETTETEVLVAPIPLPAAVQSGSKIAEGAIVAAVMDNPKRPGTAAHARYELWTAASMVGEFLAAGGTREDVRWDVRHGHVILA